jgi:hypothetical protein
LKPNEEDHRDEDNESKEPFVNLEIPIMSGMPITDRKSIIHFCPSSHLIQLLIVIGKFQAFIAKVDSVEDTEQVMHQLLSNKKIANATHNMVAYRIAIASIDGRKSFIEFRDDDGEGILLNELKLDIG